MSQPPNPPDPPSHPALPTAAAVTRRGAIDVKHGRIAMAAAAVTRPHAIELKHGRFAMLATIGSITPEVVGKSPGFQSPFAA